MPPVREAGTDLRLLVVGANHHSSPLELRDRFALIESDLSMALEALRDARLEEAVLLATCDRVELITTATEVVAASNALVDLLTRHTGLAAHVIVTSLYRHEGVAALRHLFAVASALDSLVIGEPQVLGQVKAAHRLAAEHGLTGSGLEAIFAATYATARRVRRETRIAERPVSMAAAALQLARDIHGDLDRCAALLLGAGEMGEMMAAQFRRAGLAQLVVCGPSARVVRTAQRFSCNMMPFEHLDDALAAADIVIASLGSGQAILTTPRVTAALRRRPRRPIFLIDVAIPADAEPAVNDLDGAFLYDLVDLERVALAGRATREAASADAWRVIDEALVAFGDNRTKRRAVPAVVALRRHVEALRQDALTASGGDAETATRLLANRLLHDPSEVLRELTSASPDESDAIEGLLRRLFRLGDDEERTK
jgi:glutamyl-tRNA reductase